VKRAHGRDEADDPPGASRRVEHAAQFLDSGATLVAVGTESFRDPAAGARISRELHDLFAKSGAVVG